MKHLKLFEGFLNESSYTDFLMKRSDEIKEAIKKLSILGKHFGDVTGNIDGLDDDTVNKLMDKLKVYDSNVPQQIEHWVALSKHHPVDADTIAKFALDNMNRYGTEMQMVLYAIDDYFDIIDRKYNISPEEE